MSDANHLARSLRERLGGTTEERLGKALSELLENPLLTGAIGRAFDAREKAVQAQELAMGALNLPSAADIERLTRRLRSVSLRLEGIEEGVDRLDRTLSPAGVEQSDIAGRLSAIEDQLTGLTDRLDRAAKPQVGDVGGAKPATKPRAGKAKPRAGATPAKAAGTPGKSTRAKAPAASRSKSRNG